MFKIKQNLIQKNYLFQRNKLIQQGRSIFENQIMMITPMNRSMKNVIFLIVVILGFAQCLFNPGILITIPFTTPLIPPTANLPLPLSIEPILINQLQLSQISLSTLTYTWKFTEQQASINITNMGILFFWKYKSDEGYGSFSQTSYQLVFDYQFGVDAKNRLKINILKSKSKLGHSAVHLGGNVKETVAIEVTNLILNHAAITFRARVQRLIASTIQSFSSILAVDPKLICPINPQHCLYVNLTLESPPIISNKTLLIQINGASYVTNEKSGEVNPDTMLVKKNSNKIEAQVHKKVVQQMVQKLQTILPEQFLFDITDKFDTFDLTSRVLGSLFPMMADYSPQRKITIDITNIKVNPIFNSKSQSIDATVSVSINIITVNPQTGKQQKYLTKPCNASAMAGVKIIYGWKSTSLRVNKLGISSFQCEQFDVEENFVRPQVLMRDIPTFNTLLKAGLNLVLNSKPIQLQFNGIQAVLGGMIQQNEAIFDLDLKKVQKIETGSEQSGFKVILED